MLAKASLDNNDGRKWLSNSSSLPTIVVVVVVVVVDGGGGGVMVAVVVEPSSYDATVDSVFVLPILLCF